MSEISNDRLATSSLIAAFLSVSANRAFLTKRGYTSGMRILACEWDESVGDVLGRAALKPPPCLLAIRRGDDLLFMRLQPGSPESNKDGDTASANSTIGMLYEAAGGENWTVKVTDWTYARVLTLA